jgi:hypothetical protein
MDFGHGIMISGSDGEDNDLKLAPLIEESYGFVGLGHVPEILANKI